MVPPPNSALPLAVSIGEPAGIGVDCLLMAWHAHLAGDIPPLPHFHVVCDPLHLAQRAKGMGLEADLQPVGAEPVQSETETPKKLNYVAMKHVFSSNAGHPQAGDAAGVVEAITTSVGLVKTGNARAVVTLPINKKSLYDSGFKHPGHTEFLAELSQSWAGISKPVRPVMMLAGPKLRAVPVTIHIPLKDVATQLSTASIVETASITARELRTRFGIATPRLAISGLNPHAGENGALGHEDENIIAPAVAALQEAGIECFGPLPADTMFHAAARAKYDAALCMYHDQALIPAKALDFDATVNVTLGLPFVRTSPDHGTAYDIAGTGQANPASTIAALRLADQMSREIFE